MASLYCQSHGVERVQWRDTCDMYYYALQSVRLLKRLSKILYGFAMDTVDKKDAAVDEHLEGASTTAPVNNNDNNSEVTVSAGLAECASAAAQLSAIRDPAEMGSKLSDLIQQTQQLYVTLCQ